MTQDRSDEPERISRDDVQQRAREVLGGAGPEADKFKRAGVAVAAGLGVVLVVAVYLLGRSKGRKRTTIVEVIRV